MSKKKNDKKGVNKKTTGDVGSKRVHESNRDRRIRQTAEAGMEISKRRLATLMRLNDACREYLEVSDCAERMRDVEVATRDKNVKAADFLHQVDKLMEEILGVELSLASEYSIAETALDERLVNMRKLLKLQPTIALPCQLSLGFQRASLRIRSEQWDVQMTNLECKMYPDGRPIEYCNGCIQVIKNHLEQALGAKVALTG